MSMIFLLDGEVHWISTFVCMFVLVQTPPAEPQSWCQFKCHPYVTQNIFHTPSALMAWSTKHRGQISYRNLLSPRCEIVACRCEHFFMRTLLAVTHSRSRLWMKAYWIWQMIARDSFYGPLMPWRHLRCTYITPHCLGSESSLTRKLYEHELMGEAKLLNAVDTVWDACIRIIPVEKRQRHQCFHTTVL